MSLMLVEAERREVRRYRLQLPVLYTWYDGHKTQTAGGFTRDVSVHGLFVTASVVPPVRTEVEVEVLLPPALGPMPGNTLKAPGLIVRGYSSNEPHGFAIAVQLGADFGIAENYLPQ
jgi:hypothetical protein